MNLVLRARREWISWRVPTIRIAAIVAAHFVPSLSTAQQDADTVFRASVGSPVYEVGSGPTVAIDEGHYNFHTMGGRYLPLSRLLQEDGYVVVAQRGHFTRAALDRVDILVIANALARENEDNWNLPTASAFATAEIGAVRSWVHDGGSLLLIADHMPWPGAASALAAAFGVLMSNGYAMEAGTNNGWLRFTRSDGSLADHPITRGRNATERIDSVKVFTGQAFRLGAKGESLMTLGHNVALLLPPVARQFSETTPSISASGMLQGAAITYGKGRVAVFGEAAMFTAQVAGPDRTTVGWNDPTAPQNAQFLLNVLHWLSGLL